MKNKNVRIVCPKCGTEYLPSEIYVPQAFFGKPKEIVKDCNGKIIYTDVDAMDTSEVFVCDRCNTKFNVSASINFTVLCPEFMKKESDEYVSKIPSKVSLLED